jgi:hypothetical protein
MRLGKQIKWGNVNEDGKPHTYKITNSFSFPSISVKKYFRGRFDVDVASQHTIDYS